MANSCVGWLVEFSHFCSIKTWVWLAHHDWHGNCTEGQILVGDKKGGSFSGLMHQTLFRESFPFAQIQLSVILYHALVTQMNIKLIDRPRKPVRWSMAINCWGLPCLLRVHSKVLVVGIVKIWGRIFTLFVTLYKGIQKISILNHALVLHPSSPFWIPPQIFVAKLSYFQLPKLLTIVDRLLAASSFLKTSAACISK